MENRVFRCGHCAEPSLVLANMGRGAARQRRLDAYFARDCKACKLAKMREDYEAYLMMSSTDKATPEYIDEVMARREAQLRYKY